MTTKPEPNTRAGEVYPADNFQQTGEWPGPTPEMLETILFDTIWRTIKTWDVNVPHAYSGYMGANGNHARAIYDAVRPLVADTRPIPQPSELEAAEMLSARVIGTLTKDLFDSETKVAQLEAQIAKLQADGDKLAGAAEPFVENMAYLDWLEAADDDYVDRPTKSAGDYRRLFQALTEWKDRA